MAEGIASEEQLQRAIAAEQWYWSEGESEEEEVELLIASLVTE